MQKPFVPVATLVGLVTMLGLALTAEPTAQKAVKAPSGRIPVAVVITEGATMIDFAGPWEVFQDVMLDASHDERMPFSLYTVGDRRAPVEVTGGMKIVPDYTFDDAPAPKVVVVGAQRGSPAMLKWLQTVAARKETDVVMSVCTGAFKLGDAGLLDGKAATTHHDFFDSFAKRFPRVDLKRGQRYVQSDDRIFTAGGLTSGIDLALHIVSNFFGDEVAEKTAVYMEYQGTGWRTGRISSR
jgi:transcriptional regulator GlxA family with amidase domain